MTALLTRTTKAGIVDMVAILQFARGNVVSLTDEERRVAIHVMYRAGFSKREIAERMHTSDKKIAAELNRAEPVDALGNPFTLNI